MSDAGLMRAAMIVSKELPLIPIVLLACAVDVAAIGLSFADGILLAVLLPCFLFKCRRVRADARIEGRRQRVAESR